MRTALQRQLVTTGWHLLGGLIALGLLIVGVTLWGNHIEHRIDRAQEVGISDHHALTRLATAVGHREVVEPGGGDALPSPHTATQQPAPAPTPASEGGTQQPSHHGSGGHGGGGGQPPETSPPSQPAAPAPASSQPAPQAGESAGSTSTEGTGATSPPEHPIASGLGSAVEDVGAAAGNVGAAAAGTVETVNGVASCLLTKPC